MYNEGTFPLLQIMQVMKIVAGPNVTRANERRIAQAKRAVREMTKKMRIRRRQAKLDLTETNKSTEDLLYSPGIDDKCK